MDVVTSTQMREIEERAIAEFAIPSIILMENAALAVVKRCIHYLDKRGNLSEVVIVCGKGNNGGDGFAVARLLHVKGFIAKVVYLGSDDESEGDAHTNLIITKNMGIEIISGSDEVFMSVVRDAFDSCDLIVDAIFGTGLSNNVRGVHYSTIEAINTSGRYVVSIDLPSGINADNGKVMGIAVKANETITLGLMKQGLCFYPGVEAAGEITVGSIGIPLTVQKNNTFTLNDDEFTNLLPKRSETGNKGTFGQVYVLAGSDEMPGAAVLTASAAYRAGCGLVKAYVNRHVASVLQSQLIEATTGILKDTDGFLTEDSLINTKELNKAKVVLIGPGLGNNEYVKGFVHKVLLQTETTLVIDADALNVIADDTCILTKLNKVGIITPHPGEMSRLTGMTVHEIVSNSMQVALDFAKRHRVVTVLKGARTIVADPDGTCYINVTGNSSLAKAGSGDVLTGLIGAFVAQGKNPFTASVLATYLHGRAGEVAADELSRYSVKAGDLLNAVPLVLQRLTGGSK